MCELSPLCLVVASGPILKFWKLTTLLKSHSSLPTAFPFAFLLSTFTFLSHLLENRHSTKFFSENRFSKAAYDSCRDGIHSDLSCCDNGALFTSNDLFHFPSNRHPIIPSGDGHPARWSLCACVSSLRYCILRCDMLLKPLQCVPLSILKNRRFLM